ncbi:MAG: 30S ribosomal protein S19e [Halobacteria archaeon]
MVTALDVPADDLIELVREDLEGKEDIEPPEWSRYSKTGTDRELPPEDADWWYRRTAAIFRKVYKKGPVGVSKLKKMYGGKNRDGMSPSHHEDGSGSVVRTVLQQLEDADLVETKGKEGRVVSPEGQRYLDSKADEVAQDIPELERY